MLGNVAMASIRRRDIDAAAKLDGVEGTALTKLNRLKRAEKLLQAAVTGCDDRHARNRALYRVRLARARLLARSIDGAAEAASAALDDLTDQVASRRVKRTELDTVARQLAAYRSWGWGKLGELKPFADSPTYDAMMRDLPRFS